MIRKGLWLWLIGLAGLTAIAALTMILTARCAVAMPEAAELPGCPGIAVEAFEARLPAAAELYTFAIVAPFVALWRSRPLPPLPAGVDRVSVYTLPGQPALVTYRRGGCVLAMLPAPVAQLIELLLWPYADPPA